MAEISHCHECASETKQASDQGFGGSWWKGFFSLFGLPELGYGPYGSSLHVSLGIAGLRALGVL